MSGNDTKDGVGGGAPDYEGAETLQMDPNEVAELHRRLAEVSSAGPPAARPPQPGTLQPPARPAPPQAPQPVAPRPQPAPQQAAPQPRPAPQQAAPQPRAAVAASAAREVPLDEVAQRVEQTRPAPPAKPARPPKPAAASGGGGALTLGGVGAVLLAIIAVLTFPPISRELPREEFVGYLVSGVSILGWALVAAGLSAAARRTNGVAGVAAIFAFLAMVGAVLTLALLPELRGDDRQLVGIIIFFLPWAFWALAGAWALAAGQQLGALGPILGILAVITGTAGVALGVLLLSASPGDIRDVAEILAYTIYGGTFVSAALLAAACLGPLKRASADT